jgi:hypothetical protein
MIWADNFSFRRTGSQKASLSLNNSNDEVIDRA